MLYPPREQKSRVCIQILRAYAGIRDAETQSPRGCCGNPGVCLKCAQGQKSLKGLPRATRCTDRAQTSSNVSPTVELCPPHPTFGTKVRTRRDAPEGKKNHNYTHTYNPQPPYEQTVATGVFPSPHVFPVFFSRTRFSICSDSSAIFYINLF